jgi:hypothetical protein
MNQKHFIALIATAFIGLMCVLLVAVSILGHAVAIPPV